MADFQAIADRVEIDALRGEFTDAAMMCDYDRAASLFTADGALRMPHANVDLTGREAIRAFGPRREEMVDYLVQNTHPGVIPHRWRDRRPAQPRAATNTPAVRTGPARRWFC